MDVLGFAGEAVWTVGFFLIAISIIVAIHEYGHYIVGRWTGIHAEVFSLGFGPVLFSRMDKRGTRWQVAAFPLGGYVKFLGDADAASARSEIPAGLSPEERRHTMSGAPVWARALTVAAGPVANFLLTFAVLLGVMFWNGIAQDPPTIARLMPIPQEQPLHEGDVILSLGGKATPDLAGLGKAIDALPREALVPFVVERGGERLELMAPNPMAGRVAGVMVKSAAINAGLREGDVVLRADDREILVFNDLREAALAAADRPMKLSVWRAGQTFDLEMTPRWRDNPKAGGGFERRPMLGVLAGLSFEPVTYTPGVMEATGLAGSQMWEMVTATYSGITHMIAGQISTCNMSSMIGMAEAMGDAATSGSVSFVTMLAILSLGVGILNLMPVPVLDGGHLVFCAWEAVTGKQPSEGVLQVLVTVGLTLVLALMAFGVWNDLTCI